MSRVGRVAFRHPSDVHYGPGSVRGLGRLMRDAGSRKALLVRGTNSFEASGAAAALPDLEQATETVQWSDFSANPDSSDLARGLEVLRAHRPDTIIGVGGGSTLDMAKLLCAFAAIPPPDLEGAITSGRTVLSREGRLVLSPTTSGSGSEATHFAVVYIGDVKYSIAGPALYADSVLLDPELAMSGPSRQRASSGIDAVSQAIESLWATGATSHSRRLARHALHLLLGSIEDFVQHPSERSARAMCLGSHLAGRAIDISKTTAAHALSYRITKRYGIPHGNAVALTLGGFIEMHASIEARSKLRPDVRLDEFDEAIGTIVDALGADDGRSAHRRFTELMDHLGLVTSLHSAGVATDQERADLVTAVNVERLANNPVALDDVDLLEIVSSA